MNVPMIDIPHAVAQTERTLLIVEDDKSFLQRLARAMEARGFEVRTAESVSEGLQAVELSAPAFAVCDMRLGDGNGLHHVGGPEGRGAGSIRCRLTACAGSTSSASTSCADATCRRRRAGSTCTAAPCS